MPNNLSQFGIPQSHADKMAASMVRLLNGDAILSRWADGDIRRGDFVMDLFEGVSSNAIRVGVLQQSAAPVVGSEKGEVHLGILVTYYEPSPMLDDDNDLSSASLASYVHSVIMQRDNDSHRTLLRDLNGVRLVSQMPTVDVLDYQGLKNDRNESMIYFILDVKYTAYLNPSTRQVQT